MGVLIVSALYNSKQQTTQSWEGGLLLGVGGACCRARVTELCSASERRCEALQRTEGQKDSIKAAKMNLLVLEASQV